MDEIQEIKTKLDIVALINEYTPLQKAGVNFKARCPFHTEKTPSFMVNQDRQFYYCFGCSEGGDIFTFIQKIEHLEFPEALKMLAKKAGVTLRTDVERASSPKGRLFDMLGLTAKYWHAVLKSKHGEAAMAYVKRRGLDDDTIDSFEVGYAPDSWDNLLKFLHGRGYGEQEINTAGLTVQKEQGSGSYDRFRDRITFPVRDVHGNVIGFSARALKSEEGAKYINTPETPVYHKGSVLFGLDKAKKAIRDADLVILVEGNMDVIASHRVGVTNVVAASGTALTVEQLTILKRYASTIAFCFDMDAAGQRAAQRSIDLALEQDYSIKIIRVPFGKDPDECIQKDPALWRRAIAAAVPYMDYYFDRVFSQYNIGNVDEKKKAATMLMQEIAKIRDLVERDYWIVALSQRLGVSDQVIRESLKKGVVQPIVIAAAAVKKADPESKSTQLQWALLSFMVTYPEHIGYVIEQNPEPYLSYPLVDLYRRIVLWYNQAELKSRQALSAFISGQDFLSKELDLNRLFVYVDRVYPQLDQAGIQRELVSVVQQLKKQFIQEQILTLQNDLRAAEQKQDKLAVDEILKKLQYFMTVKSGIET